MPTNLRKPYHQIDPVKLRKGAFEKLELRENVKGEKYKEGVAYRDAMYPNEVFYWQPYPKGKVKGEWHMGAVDLQE